VDNPFVIDTATCDEWSFIACVYADSNDCVEFQSGLSDCCAVDLPSQVSSEGKAAATAILFLLNNTLFA
jgi:hypothetical protein